MFEKLQIQLFFNFLRHWTVLQKQFAQEYSLNSQRLLKAVNYFKRNLHHRCFSGSKICLWYYLFKINNRNTRTRCKLCSKLTIKTPEWRQWHQWHWSGVFIVNFEHILHLILVFLLLTLNIKLPTGILLFPCRIKYYG